ncbi:MAG: phosphomannomutase/phosphoglucomutase, partial [Nitrospinota bacterium]
AGDHASGSGSVEFGNIIDPYFEMIKGKVSISGKPKVVVDSGNGCGGLVAPRLLRELGCEVVELYSEPDGTFPNHHPDPTVEKNMADLKKAVVENKAALGIGYDGDADRIGVVDDQGKLLYGDEVLMIFARDMLSRIKGGKVIFDVKCSTNLPEYIKRFGGIPIMSATGHSIIKQRLQDENAELAGEMSAHIFFAEDYYGYDDAIYATAKFIQIADQTDIPVSRFLEDVPKTYSTPEIRIDCPDDVKFGVVAELVEYYRGIYDVIDLDGVRIEFENGWGLIRASNTQPVLVLRFEAKSEEDLAKYRKEVYEKLKTFAPLADLKPI